MTQVPSEISRKLVVVVPAYNEASSIADSYVAKDLTPYCRMARSLRLTRSLRHVPRPIDQLLEVGCGAGFSAEYLAGDYGRYVGVDYTAAM